MVHRIVNVQIVFGSLVCYTIQESLKATFYTKIEFVAIASGNPQTHTTKVEQDEITSDKLYQEKVMKIIYQWNRLQ